MIVAASTAKPRMLIGTAGTIHGAAAGPVVAERIDALPGQFHTHLVGQHGQGDEEVGGREEGIGQRAV